MHTVPPLLVTLAMDAAAFARFDALRRQHFPPERNFLPAHITLFHHLPGAELEAVCQILKNAASNHAPFAMTVARLWMLGRGVAYTLDSPEAARLRAALAEAWEPWLTPQDRRQGFKPHITVQNKATPEAARTLLMELEKDFAPFGIQAVGLDLWRYLQGPWEHVAHFSLASALAA